MSNNYDDWTSEELEAESLRLIIRSCRLTSISCLLIVVAMLLSGGALWIR